MILEDPNLETMAAKITSSHLPQIYLPEPASTINRALKAIRKKPGLASKLLKTAIIWVAKLKYPLSLATLLESLGMVGEYQPVEVDASVIDWCDGLVMVDEGNSYVHLAPYKIDEEAKIVWRGSYDTTIRMLASTCLNYILLGKFGHGCRETEEELIRLLAAHPFLKYAARCSAYHRIDVCGIQSSYANSEPERDENFKVASFSEIWADNGSQDGQPDTKMVSLNDLNDAGGKDVQDGDTDRKRVQNPSVTSEPGYQDITETLLEKPNFLLALQIHLYRDQAAAPFANQWAVHKEKINSVSKLQKAARFGLTSVVDKLATNSSDQCEKDSEGSTALHEAAKEGFEDVIERLLRDDSASALVMNDYKETPMHLAKARGHHKAFSIIFEKACAGIRHHKAFSIIFKSISYFPPMVDDENYDKFITYYSIHNSGISNDPKRSKEMALINAINLQKKDVVFILLRGGVDPNCRD